MFGRAQVTDEMYEVTWAQYDITSVHYFVETNNPVFEFWHHEVADSQLTRVMYSICYALYANFHHVPVSVLLLRYSRRYESHNSGVGTTRL